MGAAERTNDRNKLRSDIDAAIEAGGAKLTDRFGRPIAIGAKYEFHDAIPVVFTVIDVVPDLRPAAEPGRFFVKMRADLMLPALHGLPLIALTGVEFPKARAAAEEPPADPPAADPPKQDDDSPATAPPPGIVLTDPDLQGTR